MSFADDTAVTRVGPGSFTAELHERWSSLVGIHGGYTAAIVANAMTAAVDDPSQAPAQLRHPVRLRPSPGTGGHRGDRRAHRQVDDHHQRPPAPGGTGAAGRPRGELRTTRPGLAYDDHVRPRDADPGDTTTVRVPGAVGHFQNADVRLDPDVVLFGGGDEAVGRGMAAPSRANRSTRPGWSPCATCSPPRSSAVRPARSRRRRSSTSCTWPPVSLPYLAGEYVYLSCRSPLSNEGFAVEDATMWARAAGQVDLGLTVNTAAFPMGGRPASTWANTPASARCRLPPRHTASVSRTSRWRPELHRILAVGEC